MSSKPENMVTRICKECGKEFKISKFQPYIIYCKEHRKGKELVKTHKTKVRELKKQGLHCASCKRIYEWDRMGMWVCPGCKTHYWVYSKGIFRTHDTPYKIFDHEELIYEGETLHEAKEVLNERLSK